MKFNKIGKGKKKRCLLFDNVVIIMNKGVRLFVLAKATHEATFGRQKASAKASKNSVKPEK